MRSFANWLNPPTPEKLAERELQNMRLSLFQAERHLVEAQMQVDYYRSLVAFLEDVSATGVESLADKRRVPAPTPSAAVTSPAVGTPPQSPRVAPSFSTVSSAA